MLNLLFAAEPGEVAMDNLPSSFLRPYRATASSARWLHPTGSASDAASELWHNTFVGSHLNGGGKPVAALQLAPRASELLGSSLFISSLTLASTLFLLALTWRYHFFNLRLDRVPKPLNAFPSWIRRCGLGDSNISRRQDLFESVTVKGSGSSGSKAQRSRRSDVCTPPVVHIPRDIQLSAQGHAAYAEALEKHGNGDVVIIPRHGRMEYVVDHRHVRNVLTDAQNYSFEKAVTNMLHMEFMLWFKNGTFVQELDKLVQDGVTPRLRAVVEKVSPIFAQEAQQLRKAQQQNDGVETVSDVYVWVHRTIAQAMVILIFGEQYLTPKMTSHFMAIVVAIANLSGIYENTHGWRHFPALWSLKTTLWAIFGTIVPRFFFGVLPTLWQNRNAHLNNGLDVEQNEYAAFFDILTVKHRSRTTNKLSPLNFLWCATVCLGIIFASIHQTAVVAVWCVVTLAQKQDTYLQALRDEWNEHVDIDVDGDRSLTIDNLKQLTLLDSFIREVMRTKGDTFAPVRYTIQDVRVGQYVIPKNSLCAPYVKRAHEHPDNYGPHGTTFDGFQWHHNQRPAVQGGHDFISFGLGRWACPGRHLAIAEIKMIILCLFADNQVDIRPGSFSVSDPMNTTSVAPDAILDVSPLRTTK